MDRLTSPPSRSPAARWTCLRIVITSVVSFAAFASAGGCAGEAEAAPGTSDVIDAYDEALSVVEEELSYLVLLEWAARPVPIEARDMPADVAVVRSDPAAMVDAIRFLDGVRGPAALDRLVELGEVVPEPVRLVLSRNLAQSDGARPQVGVLPYLQAYDVLLEQWALRSAAPLATTPVATPDPAPSRSPSTSTSTMSFATLAVAAGLLALAGSFVWQRRRRPAQRADESTDDLVLDAGRTVLSATDPDAFGRAVAAQVQRITGSTGGALLVEGQSWTAGVIDLPTAAVVDWALSTGRVLRSGGVTVAPVILDGRVTSLLVAPTTDHAAEEVLKDFAPLVGAALQSVRTRAEHEQLAFDDGLTHVGNRRRFDRDLCHLMGADAPRSSQVSLAMVDVDHFKLFNDRHGHQAGDEMLRHVADLIRANVREGDLVYRYGGEEFAVLLPGAGLDEAAVVVERVRRAVESSESPNGLPKVTVSAGVSATPHRDGTAMLRAADSALYVAKSSGRNRVVASPGPLPPP